jgi:hypothetical protein
MTEQVGINIADVFLLDRRNGKQFTACSGLGRLHPTDYFRGEDP